MKVGRSTESVRLKVSTRVIMLSEAESPIATSGIQVHSRPQFDFV